MKIFDPLNLLWLLPLVPILIFFYLLKLKRRERVISSVYLWNHLVKDVQANAPFQKLRRNLLLFLQLAILLFGILGLARPAVITRSLGGRSVVVILDGSASMQSRDAQGSRFEEARARALRMVGEMQGGERMMVLLATSRVHRLTGLTTDRNELRRAIRAAQPADTATSLREALVLAASATGSGSSHGGSASSHIYLLTDGAFPDLEEVDTRGAEVQFVRFGTRSDNVGIVAMDVRRTYRERGGYQLFLAVRNHGPGPRRGNVEFYRDDALVDVRPLDLPAPDPATGFAEKAEVFENLAEVRGILRARLDMRDDLAADDEAYAQLSPRREIQVLLVSEGSFYLERALNVDPFVKLSRVAPSGYRGQGGFDVVIFENSGPRQVGEGSHLYINCGGPTAPVDIEGRIQEASILDWDRVHPAMRFVNLSRLDLGEALRAKKRPWAVLLAEHEAGVAIAAGEKSGVKSAYIGFGILSSDLPVRYAFPILVNNLLQWLAARPGKTEGLQLRAGETVPIEIPARVGDVREVVVTGPDGSRKRLKPEGRVLYFSDTEKRGIYTVQAGSDRQAFAVNLLSREESGTRPKDQIHLGRRPVLAGTGTVRTARELWRWLLLLALVVLGVEWWVYHRRI